MLVYPWPRQDDFNIPTFTIVEVTWENPASWCFLILIITIEIHVKLYHYAILFHNLEWLINVMVTSSSSSRLSCVVHNIEESHSLHKKQNCCVLSLTICIHILVYLSSFMVYMYMHWYISFMTIFRVSATLPNLLMHAAMNVTSL